MGKTKGNTVTVISGDVTLRSTINKNNIVRVSRHPKINGKWALFTPIVYVLPSFYHTFEDAFGAAKELLEANSPSL